MLLLTDNGKVLNQSMDSYINGWRFNAVVIFSSDIESHPTDNFINYLRDGIFTKFPPSNDKLDEKLALQIKAALENIAPSCSNGSHEEIKKDSVKESIEIANEERRNQAIQEGKLGYIELKDERALTHQEKEVISHISEAFNSFIALKEKGVNDNEDFKNAANAMHRLIALRVARRADPDIWSAEGTCLF